MNKFNELYESMMNEMEFAKNAFGTIQSVNGIKMDLEKAMKNPSKDVFHVSGKTMKSKDFIKKTKIIVSKLNESMMNEAIYTTKSMDGMKAKQFRMWFKKEIGTDYEEGKEGGKIYYLLYDLNSAELKKVKAYLNESMMNEAPKGSSGVLKPKKGVDFDIKKVGKGWQVYQWSPTGKFIPQGQPHKDEASALKDAQGFFNNKIVNEGKLGELNEEEFNEASKYVKYPRADFEKLKKGDKLEIHYGDAMRNDNKGVFVVTSKSHSKKYKTDKVTMQRDGGSPNALKYFLYSRDGGDAGFAHGNAAAWMTSVKKV
jgi:hypothetical protein